MPPRQEDGLPALHLISLTQGEGDAAALPLGDSLLVDRSGLTILQASWHPGSDVHFAVLASDNVFRLYHIDDLSSPVSATETDMTRSLQSCRRAHGHCVLSAHCLVKCLCRSSKTSCG